MTSLGSRFWHPTYGWGLKSPDGRQFTDRTGLVHEVKYSPDQPRDAHGRFGSTDTGSGTDEARMIAHFGLTDSIHEAGYITPSGKLLDFTGRHYAGDYHREGDRFVSNPFPQRDYLRGQRTVDHRELPEGVRPLADIHYGDSADAGMRAMQAAGYVRLQPIRGDLTAEITRPMNDAQINALRNGYNQMVDHMASVGQPGVGFGIDVTHYTPPSAQHAGNADLVYTQYIGNASPMAVARTIREAQHAAESIGKASRWYHPTLGWGTKMGAAFVDSRGVIHEVKYSSDQPRDYHGRFGTNEAAARDTAYTLEGMARDNLGPGLRYANPEAATAHANQIYGRHAPDGHYRDQLEVRFGGEPYQSSTARVRDMDAGVHPVITLGAGMRDQLTVAHEVAHVIANEREQGLGRWAASHGNAFQDAWKQVLQSELPQHHELIFKPDAKYAPDQPRDDHGRFSATDDGDPRAQQNEYDRGGKVYVVENVMSRNGLDGGPVKAEEVEPLARAAAKTLGHPYLVRAHSLSGERSLRVNGMQAGDRAMTSPEGTVYVNQDSNPTKLDVLHEVAHVVNRFGADDEHGPEWQKLAARLYDEHISPAAGAMFREYMLPPTGAKYAPDQPRDDHGRFGSGGGSAVETAQKYEALYKDAPVEHLILVTVDGKLVVDAKGDANSASVPFGIRAPGGILTHNHPASPDGTTVPTLSPEDISAARTLGVAEVRAISQETGKVYSMHLAPGIGPGDMDRFDRAANGYLQPRFKEANAKFVAEGGESNSTATKELLDTVKQTWSDTWREAAAAVPDKYTYEVIG